jgi:ribonuclease VapC
MIVIDASAMVAIVLQEEGYEPLAAILAEARDVIASPINIWEAAVVVGRHTGRSDHSPFKAWLDLAEIQPATETSWQDALDAFWRYGRGRHPARLNMADCFAYALAKSLDAPLLYKGTDFSRTDIRSAL